MTFSSHSTLSISFCAREEIRTPTALRPLPPQSSAYTNFATHAGCKGKGAKANDIFFGIMIETKKD
jgi:hypothetical protein